MTKRAVISIVFSAVLFLGLAVCLICDLAISRGLTWSLIPCASIAFTWLVLFPGLRLEKRGAAVSLALLSVLLIPYLLLLSVLTDVREVYSVGSAVSAVSIVFLWAAALVFSRVGVMNALGIVFVLAVPFSFAVNALLSKLIGEPVCDAWDMLTVSLLLISACACFICDRAVKRKQKG